MSPVVPKDGYGGPMLYAYVRLYVYATVDAYCGCAYVYVGGLGLHHPTPVLMSVSFRIPISMPVCMSKCEKAYSAFILMP